MSPVVGCVVGLVVGLVVEAAAGFLLLLKSLKASAAVGVCSSKYGDNINIDIDIRHRVWMLYSPVTVSVYNNKVKHDRYRKGCIVCMECICVCMCMYVMWIVSVWVGGGVRERIY